MDLPLAFVRIFVPFSRARGCNRYTLWAHPWRYCFPNAATAIVLWVCYLAFPHWPYALHNLAVLFAWLTTGLALSCPAIVVAKRFGFTANTLAARFRKPPPR